MLMQSKKDKLLVLEHHQSFIIKFFLKSRNSFIIVKKSQKFVKNCDKNVKNWPKNRSQTGHFYLQNGVKKGPFFDPFLEKKYPKNNEKKSAICQDDEKKTGKNGVPFARGLLQA